MIFRKPFLYTVVATVAAVSGAWPVSAPYEWPVRYDQVRILLIAVAIYAAVQGLEALREMHKGENRTRSMAAKILRWLLIGDLVIAAYFVGSFLVLLLMPGSMHF